MIGAIWHTVTDLHFWIGVGTGAAIGAATLKVWLSKVYAEAAKLKL